MNFVWVISGHPADVVIEVTYEEAVTATTVNGFKNVIDPILRKRQGLYISQKRLSAPVFTTPSAVTAGGLR
ncbi:hypothetical protein HOLleu_20719 [Holothuria leucospilota]|uniref:Uncharacterized protein n=1 Tax=Holothuria leucospilota TaxID=206669 RepID=A0A9Q1H8N5_HOLLE|nr:hypothetical protein HOLleu_20719 [Holothuria leucospilota]